ncbi:MAG: hypothetical protein WBL45_03655 [Solirubrobacterales bacterium]
MSDVEAIRTEAERREISRLAHFTPTRNLVHIVTSSDGLKSTTMMSEEERSEFNQQDLQRLDRHPDHISCTIEYPNSYYYRKKRRSARGEERLFPNWVCLLLLPKHLWRETTLLCPHNAAGWGGLRSVPDLSVLCRCSLTRSRLRKTPGGGKAIPTAARPMFRQRSSSTARCP